MNFTADIAGIPCSMADHIATRKSTFTSASTSRKRRTHQPSVRDFGRRVSVYSKPEKYGLMAKQKQAEECVLYVRVSTTRQAEDGVSIDAQIAKGKANAEFRNLLLPDENIFIDDGVSAKVPLWSRPAAKQMKAFILSRKSSTFLLTEWTDYFAAPSIALLQWKN